MNYKLLLFFLILTHSCFSTSNDSVPRAGFNFGLFTGTLSGEAHGVYASATKYEYLNAGHINRIGFHTGFDKQLKSYRMHNFYGFANYQFYNSAIKYSVVELTPPAVNTVVWKDVVKIPCHYFMLGIGDKFNIWKRKLFFELRVNYNVLLKSSLSEYDSSQKYLWINEEKKILWMNKNYFGFSLNFNYKIAKQYHLTFNYGGTVQRILRVQLGSPFNYGFAGFGVYRIISKKEKHRHS